MNDLSRYLRSVVVTACAYSLIALLPATANASTEQVWQFRVYLDDTPIGYHEFSVEQASDHLKMTTHARFDVTFLKIPLFSYRHQDVQQWSDQCLKSIKSKTDQNGKLFEVDGSSTDKGFQLSTRDGNVTLPECISTFAYWNKSFLQHGKLLNSQTGEYLDVDVDHLGEHSITVRNTSVPANRYRLTAEDLDIELWYSNNDQWLGLQSETSSGRLLRYVIE